MPRLLSKNQSTNLGNTPDEIKYIRSVLSEIGPDPSDAEIDRAITLTKVDIQHDKLSEEFKRKNEPVKGPMDKYVVKKENK